MTSLPGNSARQLCTFFVDEHLFGIDVTRVQEVIRYQEITRVPLSASVVGGLINLRGQIVTAIEMRQLLSLRRRAESALPMNVVVRNGDSVLSLLVDEIGDVVDVDASLFERPPETLAASFRDLILGVYKLPQRLLLLLDNNIADRVSAIHSDERNHHDDN